MNYIRVCIEWLDITMAYKVFGHFHRKYLCLYCMYYSGYKRYLYTIVFIITFIY